MQVLATEQLVGPAACPPNGSEKLKIVVEELQSILQGDRRAKDTNAPADSLIEHSESNGVASAASASSCAQIPGISQLTPSLYLSGAGVVVPAVLDRLGVRFVISAAPELPDTPLSEISKPLYLRVNVLDRPDVDLSVHFDTVADMIEEVRQHGGATLVHCVAGVSRSASLCLAYLMRHGGMSLRDAYQHVKAVRPQIRPNSGFFAQLMEYERQLSGGGAAGSVRMVFYESLNKEIPDVYEPEYRAMEEFYQRHRNALKSLRR